MVGKFWWAALAALVCLACSTGAVAQNGPEVGKQSPNLIGRTMDDKLYRLSGDRGKVKVINFFWVECKPCRAEMPELGKLEKAYPKIKFISVHTHEEKPETVASFVQALPGAPSTIVLTSGTVQETFRYLGLPHTLVLSPDNVVMANFSGYTPENMNALVRLLDSLPQ